MIIRRRLLSIIISQGEVVHSFNIISDDSYVGKTFYCTGKYDGEIIYGTWSIISGSQYATINENGKVTINPGVHEQEITIQCVYDNVVAVKTITISYDNQLSIECPYEMSGTNGQAFARYNNDLVTPTWSIIEGGSYATIDSTGAITILGSGIITLQASYGGYTTTRNVQLTYVANQTTTTEVHDDGSITTTTTTTTENQDGSTTETSTSTTTAVDGSISTTNTETTTNEDGSSTSTSTTTNQDGTSSQTETNTSADGSSTSTTTNYNEDGDPTTGSSSSTDTSGNVNTQTVEYDENGDTTVTGYTVDTTNNPEGTQSFNGDGVNTEYYAFDLTHGFVIDYHFKVDCSNKPAGQNENHHNILTMKRATPSPWYGFQLRQSNTNKYVQLGTQFETGSNTNTTLQPLSLNGNIAEYDLKIIYDPTASTNNFRCINASTGAVLYSASKKFPDLPELRYLKVTLGYAMDENGDPYRYSDIDVYNFSIRRLNNVEDPVITCNGKQVTITCATTGATIYYKVNTTTEYTEYTGPFNIIADTTVHAYAENEDDTSDVVSENVIYNPGIAEPVITCDGMMVTMTCATAGATIYYRLGTTGAYSIYSSPVTISQDTTVQAYAALNNDASEIVTQLCEYESGVTVPVVTCDGLNVTITCSTPGATIYYRTGTSGNYSTYSGPISITEDTTIQAYAELNGDVSQTVTTYCVYDSGIAEPEISCDGVYVTMTSDTQGATIYYRIDNIGEFEEYTGPVEIFIDTVFEAYAELNGLRSTTVQETCIYEPVHDYSRDYLTFRILSNGTINWNAVGGGTSKTIQYQLNDGAWTSISSSPTTSISVSAGDILKFKGTNISYATSNTIYSGFGGGTATFNAEGNVMSLIYGDNFANNDILTGTYNFCSLFKESNIISAENLVLPAMTLTPHCYRAMFAQCLSLDTPPELPATTLATSCYRYMFQDDPLETAPDLLALTLVDGCYEGMFNRCTNLNYIKCKAIDISATNATNAWVESVASSGTFVKDVNTAWSIGNSGIPRQWVQTEEGVATPIIYCDGLEITLSTRTQGAPIYYRLNETGTYSLYSTPISIAADTIIEAYAQLNGEVSPTAKETCIYDDGITEPVIYCDGEYVTISCDTGGAYIYYRIDQTGNFEMYSDAIVITQDTYVEAYAEINGRRSETVSLNCIYDESLKAPIITCDGTEITIDCHTAEATIYYRLNEQGTYSVYTGPIAILADTIVEAYSELDNETSQVVTETCIYDDTHHYERDYLTFDVTNAGTIIWNSIGSGQAKTIQYSLNDGAWTTITADPTTSISVSVGDKVRFKGTNTSYAKDKSNYSGFEGGTASFNIEGNIMSLIYGDSFENQALMTGTYNFCSIFKLSNCISAENLILPSTTLTNYCYRAMFSKCQYLITAPALPATTLSQGCYWYMFEECAITTAPDLLADTLVAECYGNMFTGCTSLNYIKCMATTGFNATNCKQNWVKNVASSGTFVKASSVAVNTWSRGTNGIPTNWLVYDDVAVSVPVISCDGYNNVTITCDTQGATIYYRVQGTPTYSVYSTSLTISENTTIEAYASSNGQNSLTTTQTCEYISDVPLEASNRDLKKWNYNNSEITTPYSINSSDGHSASYAKGTFNFETSFALRTVQPTYLWFQHADQSATVYIDDVLVEKHWGGYAAFFVDISNYVHAGTNKVKVALKNNEGNSLAPASGDFNFNATLGNVKLFTSPVIPAMNYGYDGFHVTSTVSTSLATIYVKTLIPTGGTAVCTITDGTYNYTDTIISDGNEMTFTASVSNPHLWNGTVDPHLYTITLEIYYQNVLYHRYQRPYGLRFYEYVVNDTVKYGTAGNPYTGFLLNGSPYLLRGVCMHDDIAGKANALNDADYTQTFSIIQELGCNFIRLAHYPHPKETYDWCDRLGIVVQTEGPCVNKMQSTMPTDYFDHLNTQYDDMVNQHYNHPCIFFWGLSNETTTDDKAFANTKMNGYISRIKALDSERLVGYVMAQSASDPSAYYNNPNADWFGCNMYEGWYTNQNSNNPTNAINTRINNIITNKSKALAYSEYGCGGTQRCHSDDFMTTTTRGNNPRHDIEYMMWLHEGHIAAIKNYPQLMFTSQWQLFDIAVANRNEGYTVCLDGINDSTDDNLRRLNDKGLVERDHITKKDPFYLYKAWWNPTPFVHICSKEYQKYVDRVIKCYTNESSLSIYVNDIFVEQVTVTNNIALFTAATYSSGDVVRVEGSNSNDTMTFTFT